MTWDWEHTHVTYLDASDINTGTDEITWTSHGLRDRYTVQFQTPDYQGTDCGLTDSRVYFVERIDADTIKLHTSSALGGAVNLTT